MVWLSDGAKILKLFIHFDRMYDHDRQTDGQTPCDGIGNAICIALHSKNGSYITDTENYGKTHRAA